MLRNKGSISTPDTKLNSTQFSSGKLGGRGSSVQLDKKRKHYMAREDNDGNDTFITTSDYHHQMSAMDDRITKLENLVWNLYKELNGKIENNFANCQIEVNEVAQQVTQQLGAEIQDLRSTLDNAKGSTLIIPRQHLEDDGYEGSEENIEDDLNRQNYKYGAYGDQNFMKNSLDEVVEEMSSQYESNVDRSHERYQQMAEHQNEYMHRRHKSDSSNGVRKANVFIPNNLHSKDAINKLSSSEPEHSSIHEGEDGGEGEGEGDSESHEQEYYFSCHERMIKEYFDDDSSDVFANLNKDELKDNFTMPELSRSTLVDQIDYDLDNFKINESSVFDSSADDCFNTNRNLN